MPAPFFLAALLGKAAVGTVSKGLAAKASAHHGHRAFAKSPGAPPLADAQPTLPNRKCTAPPPPAYSGGLAVASTRLDRR